MTTKKGLLARLQAGETLVLAEGYVFEFERRGYLQAGAFVPEVVIEHPHLVKELHEEFVHAGSDVVEAFTYYGNREKLRLIGRENDLEKLNRDALRIARQVADDTGTLMAGNICNSTIYAPTEKAEKEVHEIFKEQGGWAVEGGADFIIAETFGTLGESMLALKVIKECGKGLPAMINLSPTASEITADGVPIEEALRRLEEAGADVVGLNCHRGPPTMGPVMRKCRAVCKGPMACVPIPYRTHDEAPGMTNLTDPVSGEPSFPLALEPWLCTRQQMYDFGVEMKELGVQVVGICCGNRAFYTRALAEGLGFTPPASRYTADMSRHCSKITDGRHEYSANAFNRVLREGKTIDSIQQ